MAAKGDLTEAGLAQVAALADGNGIQGRRLRVVAAKEGTARLRGQVMIQVAGKVTTRRVNGDPPAQATICGSRHDWQARTRSASEEAVNDPQLREQLTGLVLKEPSKGWAFETEKLQIPGSVIMLAYSETCDHCHGQGVSTCPRCRGEGELACDRCQARGRIQCVNCKGAREVDTPAGKRPCQTCQGTGEMACDICQGKTRLPCDICHGKQMVACDECQRTGRFSHIADVNLVGRSRFRLADKDIPPPLKKVLATEPPTIFNEKQADIEILQQTPTRDGLVIEYGVTLPVAQLKISLNGKPPARTDAKTDAKAGGKVLSVVVFGKKHRLGAVPPFLDSLIAPGIKSLEQAGTGKGNVAELISKATKYRLLRTAIVQALAGQADLTSVLLERYPHGLSRKTARHIDDLLDRAFLHITLRPRLQTVMAMTVLTPLASLGLYMLPVREFLIEFLGHPAVGWAMDVLLPILWLAVTALALRYVSGQALRLSLPSLFNDVIEAVHENAVALSDGTGQGQSGQALLADQADSDDDDEIASARGRGGALFGIAIICFPLLHLAAIVTAAALGGSQPDWLVALRQILGL